MILFHKSRIWMRKNVTEVVNVNKRFFLSWFNNRQPSYDNVINEVKDLYTKKLLPLEERHLFQEFHSPRLHEQYFKSKPMVILIGQYSTGKTTFIKHLLGKDFPGYRIGPEPTTDRFIIIMKGNRNSIIPGNALVTDSTKQFNGLTKFGNSFLNKIQCSLVNSPVLDSITFVDTPGILAGEKQRLERGYDFDKVLEWFSERADRILVLFDANKLDISDEFRLTIEAVKRYDDKIRILLNKADSLNQQSLLRVYGALMWSLGKVIGSPEVPRLYVGSFWDQPLLYDTNRTLFYNEERDLLNDLQTLPKQNVIHKINDINKRARLAIVHAYIMGEIYKKMPQFFGKETQKNFILGNLENIFNVVQKKNCLSPGDFPDVTRMRENLIKHDFSLLKSLNKNMIEEVKEMMNMHIPRLINSIPEEEIVDIEGGAFTDHTAAVEKSQLTANLEKWSLESSFNQYKDIFLSLNPLDGKLTIKDGVLPELIKSRLPNTVLIRICYMSDFDCDGHLDEEEFTVAMYLTNMKKKGEELPERIPLNFIPISKRHLISNEMKDN